jgi:hypothetical protein
MATRGGTPLPSMTVSQGKRWSEASEGARLGKGRANAPSPQKCPKTPAFHICPRKGFWQKTLRVCQEAEPPEKTVTPPLDSSILPPFNIHKASNPSDNFTQLLPGTRRFHYGTRETDNLDRRAERVTNGGPVSPLHFTKHTLRGFVGSFYPSIHGSPVWLPLKAASDAWALRCGLLSPPSPRSPSVGSGSMILQSGEVYPWPSPGRIALFQDGTP